jgi:hypothetical protein
LLGALAVVIGVRLTLDVIVVAAVLATVLLARAGSRPSLAGHRRLGAVPRWPSPTS